MTLSEDGKPAAIGRTVTVSNLSPTFFSDVMPYYLTSYVFLISHVIYHTTGNLLVPIWLIYAFNLPQQAKYRNQVETNLDAASERAFANDKRFMGPLYMFVLNDTLNWLWCLCIVGEINPLRDTYFDYLFENKHGHSLFNWMVFTFVWGYMAGVNGLAGHELIHKRDPFNKFLGMFTYTKVFYSHFLLEHSNGHHRNIATRDDPATAEHGESLYSFMVKSFIGGHAGTYEREVERITAEFEDCKEKSKGKKPS